MNITEQINQIESHIKNLAIMKFKLENPKYMYCFLNASLEDYLED